MKPIKRRTLRRSMDPLSTKIRNPDPADGKNCLQKIFYSSWDELWLEGQMGSSRVGLIRRIPPKMQMTFARAGAGELLSRHDGRAVVDAVRKAVV